MAVRSWRCGGSLGQARDLGIASAVVIKWSCSNSVDVCSLLAWLIDLLQVCDDEKLQTGGARNNCCELGGVVVNWNLQQRS
ncbi:hypothetical protein M0R45_030441 [Rubus argutus]|uniref:Uncharacterized protein n=1 Tax=Rubus argutus TaxID=59490 RepID=A0AAW1WD89_RUBAR